MRFMVVTFTLCLISSTSLAEECRIISKPSMRLACYDRQFPVTLREKEAPKQKNSEQSKNVDRLAEENARLTKRIGNICRGC